MNNYKFDAFLSHNSSDKSVVRNVASLLKERGIKVWFDEWEIEPGDSIPQAIESGLEDSRCLVLFMSQEAFGSKWVQLERHTMIYRDPANQERRFIPLLIKDCEIKASIRQFAFIDWRDSDKRGGELDRLVAVLRSPVRTSTNTVRSTGRKKELLTEFASISHLSMNPKGTQLICAYGKTLRVIDIGSKK